MKKSIIFILTLILMFSVLFCIPASGAFNNDEISEDMYTDTYLLVSADTGTVVFSQNADAKCGPASLVKLVTAAVVFENCENADEAVTASQSAIRALDGTGSTSAGIEVGETMSVRNLVYCMMLESANDAANVLAEHIGGSIDGFVEMMNKFAADLGCTNSHFVNPHGLDDANQYTTATDLVKIMQKAMSYPVLNEIMSTVYYDVPKTNKCEERSLVTSIDMINSYRDSYYDYAKGGKTGYTSTAGRSVAAYATKDGYTYIGVILRGPNRDIDGDGYNDNTALYDCRRMFRWAFANLKLTPVADTSTYVTEIKVRFSADADYVRLVPAKKVYALVRDGVDASSINFEYDVDEYANAPVKKGDILGKAKVMYSDSVIAEVDLAAGDDVSVNIFVYIVSLIVKVISSPVFIIAVVIILAILGVFIYKNVSKAKKRIKKIEVRKKKAEDEFDPFVEDEPPVKIPVHSKVKKTEQDKDKDKDKSFTAFGEDEYDFSRFE